ncbi:MAG: hypothetical protein EOM21_21335 [Gammaproteobacteria bacterium]|nr:hypothetical protein [Gammaproteobacteria bacterium]
MPSGASAKGILTRQGDPAEPDFSQAGLNTQVGDIANPSIWLLDADADSLVLNDVLTIDAIEYRVTAPPRKDGDGLSRVELAEVDALTDVGARWQ